MEVGLTGVPGLPVLSLVGWEPNTELAPVPILHLPEVEKSVKGQVFNFDTVLDPVLDSSAREGGMETTLILTIRMDS